ncbi:MAG: toprim domain-containing protein, partial [Ruminococcus sp.]|nr:toprim domain-containing protein [Ruminococcus sp.]
DVIALNQAGFTNAVATLGTALTQEQALLMKRYADEVIICYDSDEAGQKATARAIGFLRKAGLLIRVINIPEGKDPDEFLRNKGDKGHDAFKNVIESSGNDVEYRLNKLKGSYNLELTDGRVGYLNEAVKILSSLDNAIERDVYVSKLSKDVGVSPDAVKQQLRRILQRKNRDTNRENFRTLQTNLNGRDDKINTDRYKKPRVAVAEEGVIAYLIKNPDRLSYVTSSIDESKFQTEFNKKLFTYFFQRIKNGQDVLSSVSGDFTQDETAKIYQIANSDFAKMANDKTLRENINVINDEYFKLKTSDMSDASIDDIQERLKRLRDNHQ